MPDFAPEIYRKAAEVRMRQYESEYSLGPLTWKDFAPEVTEILDAVAADLGQHVAAKILASYDEIAPDGGLTRRGEQEWHERRKCYRAAARVAALAFLADDEAPEDSDEH